MIRGRARRYRFEDVVLLRALRRICDGKGQIRHFAQSLKNYRRSFGPLTPGANLEEFLVVQGDRLCAYDGSGVVELLTGQRALTFVLDMGVIVAEVNRSLVTLGSGEVALTKTARLKANAEREKVWAPIRRRRETGKKAIRTGG